MSNDKKPINAPSPCINCTTIQETGKCHNRNCKEWRAWFADSWNRAAAFLRERLKEKEGEDEQQS